MSISEALASRLTIPLIAAPMTQVSGPDLVIAACREGVVGSLPTHNAATTGELDGWLTRIERATSEFARSAPFAPNLVVHRSNRRLHEDLACLVSHGVELVITSVGSPEPVLAPLRAIGCQVYADVATLQHAERAIALGVDGLVLLTAGAGGQTGWANPFSFVRAVRAQFDGTIVLAGGISDGVALHAARVLGADLGYMGTKFIATDESQADHEYRRALVEASLDDVVLSTQVGGIPASLLKCWVDRQAGSSVAEHPGSGGFRQDRLLSNRTAWSGGHSVSGVDAILSVARLIEKTAREYDESRATSMERDNPGARAVT